MSGWSSGYFADSGYTYGFYPEAAPSRLAWVGLLRGTAAPTRHFSYVDLGCGQGFGLCALAALHPESHFLGVDFLPEHIAHARRLAVGAGLKNVEFREADFLDLQHDKGYFEQFDYACAHGIATWVSSAVRSALLSTASRWLRPGGLFYCSYNTWPGWLATQPFQRMVLQMQSKFGQGAAALDAAKALFGQLREAGALLFDAYPSLARRMDGLKNSETQYQLQEYNNQAWQPAHVADMMADMSQHKFNLLGSATLPELFDELLPTAIRSVIAAQTDAITREAVRDLAVNQGFRRDVYVKGLALLWDKEQSSAIAGTRFELIEDPRHRGGEAFNFKVSAGKIGGDADKFGHIIDKLASGPMALAELAHSGSSTMSNASMSATTLSMSMLLDAKMVGIRTEADTKAAKRFNQHVASQVVIGAPYSYLALPLAGTASAMTEFEMLAEAFLVGNPEPASQAIAAHLQRCERALVLNGKEISEVNSLRTALEQLLIPYHQRKKSMLVRLGGR